MASPARSIHRSGTALSTPAQSRRLIKKTENAYPRPRDRRLSRKTRAAVGKPPGSTTAELAVSSADIPAAIAVPIGNQENTSTPLLLQSTELGAASAQFNSPLAESARLMPVTASPMPAHAGALAGLIS